jgi:PhoPQ-activated pathogenicity-related protein
MLKKGYRGPITISVDSTASGQQVLFKYCKSKDNITKRALNLIGEEWCDTYTYILDEFNRTLCGDELKTSIKILNRKMVKTGIMTKFYNVTDYSFKEYVKKNICKKMDSNEYKEFTSIIDKLRNFLEKEYIPRVLNGKKIEELKEDPK